MDFPTESHVQQWKVVVFYVYTCVLTVACSIQVIFFVYIVDVKTLMELTQTQVELISAMFLIGMFFMLPVYAMYRHLGFLLANVASIGISTGGLALLTLAVHLPTVFRHLSAPLVVAHFLMASGHHYLCLMSLQITSAIVPPRHSGKAISFITALSMAGQMLFTEIYNSYFSGVEKLPSYFMLTLLVTIVFKLLYLIVYYLTVGDAPNVQDKMGTSTKKCHEKTKKYGSDSVTEDTSINVNNNFDKSSPESEAKINLNGVDYENKCEKQKQFSAPNGIMKDDKGASLSRRMCTSSTYHLFLWPSAVNMCLCHIFRNNISLLLQTMRLTEKSSLMVISMTACNLLFRLFSGLVYDKLGALHRKILLLAFTSTLSVISYLITAVWMDSVTVLLVSVCLMGVAEGITRVSTYSLGADIFGVDNNIFVQSTQMSATGVILFIVSLMVGVEYDHVTEQQSAEHSETVCYGISCYSPSYLITALACTPVPVIFVFLSRHFKVTGR